MTDDRRMELASGAALGDLTEDELRELAASGVTEQEIAAMELAIAAVVVSAAKDAMPADVRARLDARLGIARQPAKVVPLASRRVSFTNAFGWIAAAACFTLAVLGWWRPWNAHGTPASERASLMSAADAQTAPWTATADPAANGAKGDVVWSAAAQKGFMRFSGLAANDPNTSQYQLWIFDGTKDEKYPVDGGVFDVGPNGEVIVPIHAKIKVTQATLFAVTVEKPGGVVVSKRERIVVTAKVGS